MSERRNFFKRFLSWLTGGFLFGRPAPKPEPKPEPKPQPDALRAEDFAAAPAQPLAGRWFSSGEGRVSHMSEAAGVFEGRCWSGGPYALTYALEAPVRLENHHSIAFDYLWQNRAGARWSGNEEMVVLGADGAEVARAQIGPTGAGVWTRALVYVGYGVEVAGVRIEKADPDGSISRQMDLRLREARLAEAGPVDAALASAAQRGDGVLVTSETVPEVPVPLQLAQGLRLMVEGVPALWPLRETRTAVTNPHPEEPDPTPKTFARISLSREVVPELFGTKTHEDLNRFYAAVQDGDRVRHLPGRRYLLDRAERLRLPITPGGAAVDFGVGTEAVRFVQGAERRSSLLEAHGRALLHVTGGHPFGDYPSALSFREGRTEVDHYGRVCLTDSRIGYRFEVHAAEAGVIHLRSAPDAHTGEVIGHTWSVHAGQNQLFVETDYHAGLLWLEAEVPVTSARAWNVNDYDKGEALEEGIIIMDATVILDDWAADAVGGDAYTIHHPEGRALVRAVRSNACKRQAVSVSKAAFVRDEDGIYHGAARSGGDVEDLWGGKIKRYELIRPRIGAVGNWSVTANNGVDELLIVGARELDVPNDPDDPKNGFIIANVRVRGDLIDCRSRVGGFLLKGKDIHMRICEGTRLEHHQEGTSKLSLYTSRLYKPIERNTRAGTIEIEAWAWGERSAPSEIDDPRVEVLYMKEEPQPRDRLLAGPFSVRFPESFGPADADPRAHESMNAGPGVVMNNLAGGILAEGGALTPGTVLYARARALHRTAHPQSALTPTAWSAWDHGSDRAGWARIEVSEGKNAAEVMLLGFFGEQHLYQAFEVEVHFPGEDSRRYRMVPTTSMLATEVRAAVRVWVLSRERVTHNRTTLRGWPQTLDPLS